MKILIATDAWEPQVNGVVRTYQRLNEELTEMGHEVFFVTPSDFFTLPCPTYPEIRLSLLTSRHVGKVFKLFKPNAIHIATEGPIGWATRRACLKAGAFFTTSYHTRFPEYVAERVPVPASAIYKIVRRFHNRGAGIMVATQSLAGELEAKGFQNILPWTRGVNLDFFRPMNCRLFGPEKVALYVGRVAPEKNLEAFLDLEFDIDGGIQKVIVGDGPSFAALKQRYKDVIFTGAKQGEELAACYSSADVFVFPSLTDTFGIVLLEAMASGVPVAAFPVTGPIDVVENGVSGCLNDDLSQAIMDALKLDPTVCRAKALDFNWRNCAEVFVKNLAVIEDGRF